MEEKIDIAEKISEGYIRAVIIIEVLGRPIDYVSEALKKITEAISSDKEVIFLNKKTYKPKTLKEAKELFTAFTEVEILAKDFLKLFEICFDYMPSSIEIIEPAELRFNLADANSIINDLAGRLHKYDEVAKRLNIEKQILFARLEDAERKTKEKEREKEKAD